MAVDQDKLMDFLHRFVGDLGATMAAGGYVSYDPATGRYGLTDEQEFALTDPDGPVFVPGAFQAALAALKAEPAITRAFRTGSGVGWHEYDEELFVGTERFFRPGYLASLTSSWLPALDGVAAKLTAGARVADIGCGHGASTVLMAAQYPSSRFAGSDYHEASVAVARKRAADAGLGDRVSFEAVSAQDFGGGPFDLVTSFDCLHDMGDPAAAARNVRAQLAPDGTWMIVKPAAGDQPGGYALGAQAGEAPISRIAADAGFTRFRRVAQTPFNFVYAARP